MVDILLSTYNGETYLVELIDSIIRQKYNDWRLVIRDDSSKDGTVILIKRYIDKYPGKITLVDLDSPNLGCNGSFERLLSFVEGDYFMFCDQDDIWTGKKIERSMMAMENLEKQYGADTPLLVCGDATCIDENGTVIYPSFFENQKFVDTTDAFAHLMSLNVVQGATTLFNKACLEVFHPLPKNVLYDYWMALCVSNSGRIVYIHEPLLLYRQHGDNVLGALSIGMPYFVGKMKGVCRYFFFYRICKHTFKKCPSFLSWLVRKVYYSMKRL